MDNDPRDPTAGIFDGRAPRMVRLQLAELVEVNGASVLDDPRRVRALLSDAVASARREINLVNAALSIGAVDRLRAAAGDPLRVRAEIDQLTGQMIRDLALHPDAAAWAVQTCAWALKLAAPPDDMQAPGAMSPDEALVRPAAPPPPISPTPISPTPISPLPFSPTPVSPLPARPLQPEPSALFVPPVEPERRTTITVSRTTVGVVAAGVVAAALVVAVATGQFRNGDAKGRSTGGQPAAPSTTAPIATAPTTTSPTTTSPTTTSPTTSTATPAASNENGPAAGDSAAEAKLRAYVAVNFPLAAACQPTRTYAQLTHAAAALDCPVAATVGGDSYARVLTMRAYNGIVDTVKNFPDPPGSRGHGRFSVLRTDAVKPMAGAWFVDPGDGDALDLVWLDQPSYVVVEVILHGKDAAYAEDWLRGALQQGVPAGPTGQVVVLSD